jgi:hypothetical protein
MLNKQFLKAPISPLPRFYTSIGWQISNSESICHVEAMKHPKFEYGHGFEIIQFHPSEDELNSLEYFINEAVAAKIVYHENSFKLNKHILRNYEDLLKIHPKKKVDNFEKYLHKFVTKSLDAVTKATNKQIKRFMLASEIRNVQKDPQEEHWHNDINQRPVWRVNLAMVGPSTPVFSKLCNAVYRAKSGKEAVAFISGDIDDEDKLTCHAVPARKKGEHRWMIMMWVLPTYDSLNGQKWYNKKPSV